MFAIYTKTPEKNGTLTFKFIDEIRLFGNQNGILCNWLKTQPLETQKGWHIVVSKVLKDKDVVSKALKNKDVVSEVLKNDVSFVININPKIKKINPNINPKYNNNYITLCELTDIWGYSYKRWTPILMRMEVLKDSRGVCLCENEIKINNSSTYPITRENDKIILQKFDTDINAKDVCYTFLRAQGGLKGGNLEGRWLGPGVINSALLYQDAMKYFLKCIKKV